MTIHLHLTRVSSFCDRSVFSWLCLRHISLFVLIQLFCLLDQVELEVGRIYMNLGVARTALAIFERLEYWGEVIECLQICKDFDAAHKLVHERMKLDGETPELLCILGDIQSKNEDKIATYQRAWEVSKGRSGRAKRQLGIMAMNEQKLKEAIGHFKQALAINPQYVSPVTVLEAYFASFFELNMRTIFINRLEYPSVSLTITSSPDSIQSIFHSVRFPSRAPCF